MAAHLNGPVPTGIGDWSRHIYDDEVMFWSQSLMKQEVSLYVSQYPFVRGFFVTKMRDHDTYIDAGPFPTLETAIASIALLA